MSLNISYLSVKIQQVLLQPFGSTRLALARRWSAIRRFPMPSLPVQVDFSRMHVSDAKSVVTAYQKSALQPGAAFRFPADIKIVDLAQLALVLVLRQPAVTSVLIGASKVRHIEDAVAIQDNLELNHKEQQAIEEILDSRFLLVSDRTPVTGFGSNPA